MGSGRFSRFRLLLKNTFALDGASKRFVWMVAEAVLGVLRILRGELLLRPAAIHVAMRMTPIPNPSR